MITRRPRHVSDPSSTGDAASASNAIYVSSRAFFANKDVLYDRNIFLTQRLRFFDAVVTPVACLVGHRAIFQADIRQYDVAFSKFLRGIVGPPAGIDWNMPWHQILHQWNVKALHHWEALSHPTWGEVCLRSHWHFAMHVAGLPRGRWIKRALEWRPKGRFAPGRPRTTWTTCLEKFARFKRWCDWATAASQGQMRYQARDEFCRFVMGQ